MREWREGDKREVRGSEGLGEEIRGGGGQRTYGVKGSKEWSDGEGRKGNKGLEVE